MIYLQTSRLAVTTLLLGFALPSLLHAESSVEDFLRHEVTANVNTVRVAELGKNRATNPEVKALAEKLAAEHREAGIAITGLAKEKGVTLKEVPADAVDEDYKDLADVKKEDFDQAFLNTVIEQHEESIEELEEASTDSKDAEIKAWATKMLPGLKVHQEKAEALRDGVKALANKAAAATAEPDNTKKNMRDRDGRTLTPMDQGNSQADIDITARIRREVVARDGLSVNAQNAKIITNDGRVTLRGPVDSTEEKKILGDIANQSAGGAKVDNQLEVETPEPKN